MIECKIMPDYTGRSGDTCDNKQQPILSHHLDFSSSITDQ